MTSPKSRQAQSNLTVVKSSIEPRILLAPGRLDRLPEEIAHALSHPNAAYFRRGLLLMKAVRVLERSPENAGVIRQAGALTLVRADADLVRRDLARYADVLKWDQRQERYCPADLSTTCAKALLASAPELVAFPIVKGIATVPIMRNDGTISLAAGYDVRSQFIFDTGGVDFTRLSIPTAPTSSDVAAALSILKEPLQDFAFVSEADRSVVLSAVLSSVARPTLGTCPLHGFSAPSFGAGKTLLVACDPSAPARLVAKVRYPFSPPFCNSHYCSSFIFRSELKYEALCVLLQNRIGRPMGFKFRWKLPQFGAKHWRSRVPAARASSSNKNPQKA